MKSQISQKTNIKKNQPMKLFPEHLASNLHIGMSRDLTSAFYFMKIHPGIREISVIKVCPPQWFKWWRYGGGVLEVGFRFGGVLTGFLSLDTMQSRNRCEINGVTSSTVLYLRVRRESSPFSVCLLGNI